MQKYTTLKKYKDLRSALLKNKKTRAHYQDLEPEFAFVRALIHERLKKGLTQTDLAKKINTKQAVISRFESGHANPTLDFLRKVSRALGKDVTIVLK